MLFFTACFNAQAQNVPLNESAFTEYVAEKMRLEIAGSPTIVKSPLTLSIGGLQANLDRIHFFCKSNIQNCNNEINVYIKGVADVLKNKTTPLNKNDIRLVVRTTAYIKNAQTALGADGPKVQSKPFVEGLVIVPVLDTPRAVRPLTNLDLTALKLSQDEAHELGLKNLQSNLKPLPQVPKPAKPSEIAHISGNAFDSSRVLLHSQWASLAKDQGGTLIVALPATDVLLYISESTPTAIEALRLFSRGVISTAPNQLTTIILKYTSAGWEVLN